MAHETSQWTINTIPDLSGRTYMVTGPTSGLGFETARVLADNHATVLMVGRNAGRLADARARIADSVSEPADLRTYQADMSSLDQVHVVADQIAERHHAIDGLVLNAGVLQPKETETHDGYEVHMGVNFLAPALLAGKLLSSMPNTSRSAIVFVGSSGERFTQGDVDLLRQESFRANTYSLSKKALHGFALALHEQLTAHQYHTRSIVAEPGTTKTELFDQAGIMPGLLRTLAWRSASTGARSILRAATDPTVPGGSYLGPTFLGGVKQKRPAGEVLRPAFQQRMWQLALREIEVAFPWDANGRKTQRG